ncbi:MULTISPECIES: hypothetical protein, partial [Enterococcus]|uniref:hypothetical protein n=1 Tax=Enterococcus TaxID=1350 RepID=UPI0035647D0E
GAQNASHIGLSFIQICLHQHDLTKSPLFEQKIKKKKGNAEAFPFSDLMRTTRFDLEPKFVPVTIN